MKECMIATKTVEFGDGRSETHAIVIPDCTGDYVQQLESVRRAIASLGVGPLMVRYFLSDAANQPIDFGCDYPVSIVQQPPLCGAKVAAWVWARTDVEPHCEGSGVWTLADGKLKMVITTGATASTRESLEELNSQLIRLGGSLAESCQRTWLFVRDIDRNYAEVVAGRNRAFETTGMNRAGHFIASTGIQGSAADPKVLVSMDSVSYIGLDNSNITYLKAPDFLNPTMEYGVAFERATALDLPGRRQVFVSGTASINNRGEVEHPGDVVRQSERMIQNVEALLAEAGCSMADAMHFLIYLRDGADAPVIERMFAERFPDVPHIILLAPVCRPQWLIEMECMAVRK